MSSLAEPSFSIGIEEEYFLVSRQTRDLVSDPPAALMAACEAELRGQVTPEFLRSQVEVGTKVCQTLPEVRADLAWLRSTLARISAAHGMAPIAASTHPFAQWHEQMPTDKERYSVLAHDLQGVGRRLLICGMHVHVGIDDDELRIDLLNQASYFLPHLLALTTSSPFWRGQDSGLKSYRLSVFNGLPRTGLPEAFSSYGEYLRHLRLLSGAGLIQDASKLWWDMRPSVRFPTLEMRITDVCTHMDDAISVAALYRCLLRMLYRLRRSNQRWRVYARMLVNENRWRAQRYGYDGGLVDFGRAAVCPYPQLLEEMIELVREDAAFFGCEREVEATRDIVARGTSAHHQSRVYAEALAAGADPGSAARAVVDYLIEATVADL